MSEINKFHLIKQSGKARIGKYVTHHGEFDTPNFMPVGTKASVKGIDCERLKEIGTQITLVNTYHLWLRPGPDLIARQGGIHKFCGWSGPILSDSGGFQIFSLKDIRKLSEAGVEFKSHLDGAKMFLSPELAIQIQEKYGVDIAMVLDECPASDLSETDTAKSLDLTIKWAKRCLEARTGKSAVFGITQGGLYPNLRQRAAEEIGALPFDGIAIGGLSVGEKKSAMYDVLSYHVAQLPKEKIHYLMGVGTPFDIINAVHEGVDLFDCVMPTRSGRFGRAFISGAEPYINIKNLRFAEDSGPLDTNCDCLCCRRYSRAYLNHLFKNDEMLGPQLLSLHNLAYYLKQMQTIRDRIYNDTFEEYYETENKRWSVVSIGLGE